MYIEDARPKCNNPAGKNIFCNFRMLADKANRDRSSDDSAKMAIEVYFR